MEELKFIKVESLNGYHIIKIKLIKSVSPMVDSGRNKSKICLTNDNEAYYSTEDQNSIYNKIKIESI